MLWRRPSVAQQKATPMVANKANCQWRDLTYQLKVSARRTTIGFRVKQGQIIISVPRGLPKSQFDAVMESRYQRLQAKLIASQNVPAVPVRSLSDGNLWPVWGVDKKVYWCFGSDHSTVENATDLVFYIKQGKGTEASKQRHLEHWYKQQALEFVSQRVDYWQLLMARDLPKLATKMGVRHFSARWGSCSASGELKFNWLLAMAPQQVFDYVVVHELCHLKHMHHQPVFWQMVAIYCSDYKAQRLWLKDRGYQLVMGVSR